MKSISNLLTFMLFCAFAMLCLAFATGCKTAQQPARPMESYETQPEERSSTINIPVRITVSDLEQAVNKQLSGVVYEDKTFDDGDDLKVKATKRDRINIVIDSQLVKYRVPLSLQIQYNAGITVLEATGDIALHFKTQYTIRPDWNLETITSIEGYDWLQKPRVKMVGMNLPVGFIADMIMKNSKKTIAKAIDEEVGEQLRLDNIMKDAWRNMFNPVLVSPEYKAWLLVNPQRIGMAPLKMENNEITTTIVVESKPTVRIGEKPATPNLMPLPDFKYTKAVNDEFVVNLKTEISYREAEQMARKQLVGETFSQGKRSVKVEDVQLYGQDDQLIVNTRLSGAYNGSIYLTGKPVFHADRNIIDVQDLKFTLDTQNFLHRSAGWLLKSAINKKIQENLDFLLDYNLKDLQTQLQQQLADYQIAQGIRMKGQLSQLQLQNAFLTVDGFNVQLGLRGKVNVLVSELN